MRFVYRAGSRKPHDRTQRRPGIARVPGRRRRLLREFAQRLRLMQVYRGHSMRPHRMIAARDAARFAHRAATPQP
jgi:hypothetical protein